MLRLLLLPALLFIAPISLLAQQPARCVFTGSIHLESNGSPISNAQLFVSDYAPTRGKMDVNWPSSFTDAEGNFSMDLKGQANFLRIIRTQGDTIDIGVRGFQCNTHQDIIVGYVTKPAETKTYVIGEMPYVLPGVTLQAFSSRSTLNRIPASVGYIDKQLLESTDPEGVISKYLAKKGEGMHHIAFLTDDIEAEIQRLKSEGFEFVNEVPKDGADNKRIVFLHPRSTCGVLVELCEEKKN